MSNRCVLDLGCGRGRWVRGFALRGARVTGVDISPDAIQMLRSEMPRHTFMCVDITQLEFPEESFDVVSSVTVLQHLPEGGQRQVVRLVSRVLKKGGYFVLLENTSDFDSFTVFPHSPQEWVALVGSTGLRCCLISRSNFEPLIRIGAELAGMIGFGRRNPGENRLPPSDADLHRQTSLPGRIGKALATPLAFLSYPLEWVLHKLPVIPSTHCVVIFQRPS